MKRVLIISALFIVLFTIVACGSTGNDDLTITDVKANLTLPTETGAVYMKITNDSSEDDVLIGAEVPGCGAVELHEMAMEGDLMVMQEVEGGEIAIPSGETVELKQGGLHVMCLNKTGNFAEGDTVDITLEFANAGTIEVSAEVVVPGEMGMDQ